MALSVVGSAGWSGSGVNTDATFTSPTVEPDDLFLMIMDTNPSTVVPTDPSGWTEPTSSPVNNSGSMRTWFFWKWATGSEDGTTQGWTSGEWGTAARKGIGWIVVRGVDKTTWDGLTDSERFQVATSLNAATTSNATHDVSGRGGEWGSVSLLAERSSTETTSFTQPSGYTLTSNMTYTTGSGVCQTAVAWDLDPETTTIGGGTWGHNSAGGITVVSVALPIASTGSPADVTPAAGALAITGTAPTVTTGGGVNVTPSAGSLTITGGANVKTPPTRTDWVAALTYPQLIAHRGGNPGPENTIYAAINSAAISESILIEVDIEVLSDGVLVGNHDDTIDRMASASSPFTTGDVSTFDSADWATILFHVNSGFSGDDQPASFWHEFVTEFAGTPRILVPEVKDSTGADELIRQILDEGIEGQCIVQAFSLTDAQAAAAAGLHAMHLDNTPDIATLDASGIEFVGIDFATLTGGTGATIVSDAHAAGMKVAVYLVNNVTNRNTAIAAGADLIFTNSPNALLLSQSINAPAGALTISGTAPVVSTGIGVNVAAPAGVLGATGTAPDVAAGAHVEPTPGALAVSGTAPALAAGAGITPSPGALLITGTAPVMGAGQTATVEPPAGLLTIAATAPELAAAANVAATAGLLALVGTAPAISGAVDIAAPAGVLTITGTAPAVTTPAAGQNITITAGTLGAGWSATLSPGWSGS